MSCMCLVHIIKEENQNSFRKLDLSDGCKFHKGLMPKKASLWHFLFFFFSPTSSFLYICVCLKVKKVYPGRTLSYASRIFYLFSQLENSSGVLKNVLPYFNFYEGCYHSTFCPGLHPSVFERRKFLTPFVWISKLLLINCHSD